MTDPARALRLRNPELVTAVLGLVYDAHEPIPWVELVATFTAPHRPWKTIENTLYDLTAYGALHRIGQAATRRRPDTRALKPTPLGRAWLDRELLPLPADPHDPLEPLEEIAHHLEEAVDDHLDEILPTITLGHPDEP